MAAYIITNYNYHMQSITGTVGYIPVVKLQQLDNLIVDSVETMP